MAYFLKLNRKSTWNDILENRQNKREYAELIKIPLPETEFQNICENLMTPHPCYAQYSKQCVINGRDKLPCIVIESIHTGKRLILYTAGRIAPLFAAAEE